MDEKQEIQSLRRELEQANYDLTNAETDLRTAEDAALRLQGEEKQHHVLVQALTDAITGSQREQELLEKRIGADSGRRSEQVTVFSNHCVSCVYTNRTGTAPGRRRGG